MADEGALNTAIDALRDRLDGLKEAVAALIEKVKSLPDVDLTDEIARIEALVAEVGDVTDQITEALSNPEPPPA